jgi:pimeloyl-ACP methyl ester carboxylesterase
MRDLLTLLEVDRVTVVGHSFGGGIAMQFAYQFPERTSVSRSSTAAAWVRTSASSYVPWDGP